MLCSHSSITRVLCVDDSLEFHCCVRTNCNSSVVTPLLLEQEPLCYEKVFSTLLLDQKGFLSVLFWPFLVPVQAFCKDHCFGRLWSLAATRTECHLCLFVSPKPRHWFPQLFLFPFPPKTTWLEKEPQSPVHGKLVNILSENLTKSCLQGTVCATQTLPLWCFISCHIMLLKHLRFNERVTSRCFVENEEPTSVQVE